MGVDLVSAGAAVVDDALLEEGVGVVHYVGAELGADDAVLPAEVDVGSVHAGYSVVLVNREDAFVEEAFEALEVRPHLAEIVGHVLHDADGLGAADGEEHHLLEAAAEPVEDLCHLAEAHTQGVARCDYVANHEHAVLLRMQLLVLDVEAGYDASVDHSLTGHEVDALDVDARLAAAFLERVVEAAAEDGQDAYVLRQPVALQILQACRGGGTHSQIGIVSDDFRRSHQTPCSLAADDIIVILNPIGLQLVDTRFI